MHEIIHREGNIEGGFRIQVTVGLRLETNTKNGSTSVRRDDPPADNRLRFATTFDSKEGGNIIVDRCRDYLDALKLMVKDWEDNYLKSH
jgi:hypothetical protein